MHTPGDWKAKYLGNGEWKVLTSGRNPEDMACICLVTGGLGMSIEDDRDYESEANARLLAASPKLLRSLQEMLSLFELIDESQSPGTDCYTVRLMAQEVINEAIGTHP